MTARIKLGLRKLVMPDGRDLAKSRGAEFLISDDDSEHKDAYEDGLSPSDELDEQAQEAVQHCL